MSSELSSIWSGCKVLLIVSLVVGSVGCAVFAYGVFEESRDQARQERLEAMSDVEKQYSVNASCEDRTCLYTIKFDGESTETVSEQHSISVSSEQTVEFNDRSFDVTYDNKTVTVTSGGELVDTYTAE